MVSLTTSSPRILYPAGNNHCFLESEGNAHGQTRFCLLQRGTNIFGRYVSPVIVIEPFGMTAFTCGCSPRLLITPGGVDNRKNISLLHLPFEVHLINRRVHEGQNGMPSYKSVYNNCKQKSCLLQIGFLPILYPVCP